MRCVIYTRVSTDAQERDGTSLQTQEQQCRQYALERGWTVVEVAADTSSGYNLERTALDQVRTLARNESVDVVLTHALDRLSRKQTHVAILMEEMASVGAVVEFVTERFEDTAVGQLMMSVKAFAAEFEREKIAERTMRGKAERARSGRLPQATGRGLYGYKYNSATGKREIVEHQAVIVRRIFEDFAAGSSISSITNALNQEGIPTKLGKAWWSATIFHLLKNEAYAGRTFYRKTKAVRNPRRGPGQPRRHVLEREADEWIEVPGATPALVSEPTFAAVQTRLNDPERLRIGRRKAAYPLHGHVKCKQCGSSMTGQTLKRGRYRYYRCRRAFAGPKHDRCGSRYVRAGLLEETVLREAAAILSHPDIVVEELQRESEANSERPDRQEIDRRIEDLEKERQRVMRLFQLGEVDEEYVGQESTKIREQQERLRASITPSDSVRPPMPDVRNLDEVCGRIRESVLRGGPEQTELVVAALQLRIEAQTDEAEMTGVIPEEYAASCKHADVCSVVGSITQVPFTLDLKAAA